MFRLTVELSTVTPEIKDFMKVCGLVQHGNSFIREGNLDSMLKLASHIASCKIDSSLRDKICMVSVIPKAD